jgi:pimeloyl-ACP methyl ester carboxylesterase
MLPAIARQFLYPAPPVAVPSPPPAPLSEAVLELSTVDRAMAWTGAPAELSDLAPVVLFFHGNGENLETMRQWGFYDALFRMGIPFLAADYPGYGRSTGTSSEAGLAATGEAAVAWAKQAYPGRPIVLAGWSLGAALALGTAAAHPEIAGLIVLAAWTTLADAAREIFPALVVQALVSEAYDSLAAARRIQVPALVVHGDRDELIPFAHGEKIAQALAGTTRFVPVPGIGHNDLLGERVVWEEMAHFLVEVARTAAGPQP